MSYPLSELLHDPRRVNPALKQVFDTLTQGMSAEQISAFVECCDIAISTANGFLEEGLLEADSRIRDALQEIANSLRESRQAIERAGPATASHLEQALAPSGPHSTFEVRGGYSEVDVLKEVLEAAERKFQDAAQQIISQQSRPKKDAARALIAEIVWGYYEIVDKWPPIGGETIFTDFCNQFGGLNGLRCGKDLVMEVVRQVRGY